MDLNYNSVIMFYSQMLMLSKLETELETELKTELKSLSNKGRQNDGFSGVDAVERAFTLLNAFNEGCTALSLKELSNRSGLTKPTILRLAVSMEKFSYMVKDSEGLYHLGPMLWRLGSLFRQNLNLEVIIKPVLEELVKKTGESASFYIPRGKFGICLYRINSKHLARDHIEAGEIIPMGLGSSGQILKAFLNGRGKLATQIRKERTYVSIGQRDPYIAGVAAVVTGPGDEVIGSLSISGITPRFDERAIESYRTLILEAAQTIEQSLGRPNE